MSTTAVKNDLSYLNDLEHLHTYCKYKNIKSSVLFPPITVYEVYHYLINLKQTATRGLDGIDAKILKLSAPVITDTLTYIYNRCLDNKCFPNNLKQAKIIPIYKAGDKSEPSNYRPISILPVLSKPLEKHIYKHVMSHISKYDLLHPNQSGFRENYSCHTALTNLVDKWLLNINDNKITGVLFVDFSKAFDVIDHSLLLRKLNIYNFSEQASSVIRSFLSNRQQCVCLDRTYSKSSIQKFGVPQGSVLGPILFLLYINDLPLSITETCELFADDTTIHTSHSDLNVLFTNLQENINQLVNWTELNHMSLNDQKTKFMVITSRQKRQNLSTSMPNILVNNTTVDEVCTHKILGVTLDNNLCWTPHINILSKRISQKIFQLSKITLS